MITATFKHSSADVLDLVLSDFPLSTPNSGLSVVNPPTADTTSSPETIGVTGNHPFWSVDRAEFVQAGELTIGERLQTLGGDIRWVQPKLPRPGPTPVYNLEVQDEHVYYVGANGVLAHNAGDAYSKGTGQQKVRGGYWVESDPHTLKPLLKKRRPNRDISNPADDIAVRFKGQFPFLGEDGRSFAERVLTEFDEFNSNDNGPGSLFNRLKKCADRHFTD